MPTEVGRFQVGVQRCPLGSEGPWLRSSSPLRAGVGEEIGEELARRKWTWKWRQRWWRSRRRTRRRWRPINKDFENKSFKGKGKGKSKGKITIPDNCEIKFGEQQKPICMKYNIGTCRGNVKPGKRCQYGYHVCWKKQCHKSHSAVECTSI